MANMDKDMINTMEAALKQAKNELSYATHLEECGGNAGIRKINANKAEWLKWVVYLAEHGLKAIEEEERLAEEQELVEDEDVELICDQCPVTAETKRLVALKDDIIQSLRIENEDLTDELKSLQLTYDCEVEYRKALANRTKIDYFTEVIKLAHERCWLDGTVLVTPVEYLDRSLLELIKE
jgi:NACalpha-BTF3-like transcription factor